MAGQASKAKPTTTGDDVNPGALGSGDQPHMLIIDSASTGKVLSALQHAPPGCQTTHAELCVADVLDAQFVD